MRKEERATPNPWYNPRIECTMNVSKKESDKLREEKILEHDKMLKDL